MSLPFCSMVRKCADRHLFVGIGGGAAALFRHSSFGDLTSTSSLVFYTAAPGPSRQVRAYAAIAAAMNVTPAEVLFFFPTR